MALLAGVIVLIPGMPLLAITLNANLLATVLMPAALVFLLILANDREIMGARVNSRVTNLAGVLITLLYALKDRNLKTGLATLCLGGGGHLRRGAYRRNEPGVCRRFRQNPRRPYRLRQPGRGRRSVQGKMRRHGHWCEAL